MKGTCSRAKIFPGSARAGDEMMVDTQDPRILKLIRSESIVAYKLSRGVIPSYRIKDFIFLMFIVSY